MIALSQHMVYFGCGFISGWRAASLHAAGIVVALAFAALIKGARSLLSCYDRFRRCILAAILKGLQ
ncbi:hypothetical protein [Sphingobium aquiterrae]|uniref:hypothetical protein n=1 Tax=Sphingobium aquiterrae TaxID=2038656 RepID=UPI0030182179